LYLHGAPASRMLRALRAGGDLCVTVTLVDGLVLAASAMHHSMNYRSAVVMGKATEITDPAAKTEALRAIVEHSSVPGRWEQVRPPLPQELAATMVVTLPLEHCSAKVRTGGPTDNEEDLALPVWTGEVPLRLRAGTPVPCAGRPLFTHRSEPVQALVTQRLGGL
ncbi:MAG: pyridoxamine 5'-phosphate oxidase family protein, partial [Actinomycetota bacterium]